MKRMLFVILIAVLAAIVVTWFSYTTTKQLDAVRRSADQLELLRTYLDTGQLRQASDLLAQTETDLRELGRLYVVPSARRGRDSLLAELQDVRVRFNREVALIRDLLESTLGGVRVGDVSETRQGLASSPFPSSPTRRLVVLESLKSYVDAFALRDFDRAESALDELQESLPEQASELGLAEIAASIQQSNASAREDYQENVSNFCTMLRLYVETGKYNNCWRHLGRLQGSRSREPRPDCGKLAEPPSPSEVVELLESLRLQTNPAWEMGYLQESRIALLSYFSHLGGQHYYYENRQLRRIPDYETQHLLRGAMVALNTTEKVAERNGCSPVDVQTSRQLLEGERLRRMLLPMLPRTSHRTSGHEDSPHPVRLEGPAERLERIRALGRGRDCEGQAGPVLKGLAEYALLFFYLDRTPSEVLALRSTIGNDFSRRQRIDVEERRLVNLQGALLAIDNEGPRPELAAVHESMLLFSHSITTGDEGLQTTARDAARSALLDIANQSIIKLEELRIFCGPAATILERIGQAGSPSPRP